MQKIISWFEIPATDLERAIRFYSSVLDVPLHAQQMGEWRLAIFPYDRETATGGCLQQGRWSTPGRDGVIVYLNAGEFLDPVLARVQPAGGSVTVPKTELPNVGVWAQVFDTEGNRVGLFALK
jgi:hypothetical protein